MMKSIFFACLVAAVYAEAAPEADADAWYGYGAGYGYGYAARPYYNLGYRSYSPYYGSRTYGAYPVHHAIGKRSADAEAAPEADADAWYGNYGYAAASPAYYGGYRNYGYNTYAAAVPAVRSYNTVAGYASYAPYAATRAYAAYPATYGYGHAIGKRSADAEAAPEADADAWYGNYGYAAASPAYGYSAYAAPAVSYAAAPVSAYRYAAATPAYGYRAASYAPYAARSYGYAARSYGLW